MSDPWGEEARNPGLNTSSSAALFSEAVRDSERRGTTKKEDLFNEMRAVSPAALDAAAAEAARHLDDSAGQMQFRPCTPVYGTFDQPRAIIHSRAGGRPIMTPPGRTASKSLGIGVDVQKLANMNENFLNQYIDASLKVLAQHEKEQQHKWEAQVAGHPERPPSRSDEVDFSKLPIDAQIKHKFVEHTPYVVLVVLSSTSRVRLAPPPR